jgi:hypothetical protein
MKLDNVKSTSVSFNEYKKRLRKQGYRKLGSGLYAEVYSKKGCNHVIKLAHMCDHLWHHDGYLAYLRHIDPSNPMFPRIKSVERFNYKEPKHKQLVRYYAVKMERLIEYEDVDWDTCDAEFKRMGIESFYDFEEPPAYAPKLKDKVVKSAYKTLQKLWRKFSNDLHDGNVMWRKEKQGRYQLVITDPATLRYGCR